MVEHNLAKVRVAGSSPVFRSHYVSDASLRAQVAELVDALVSGSSDESRGGSSPLVRITENEGVTIKSNSLFSL